MEKMLDHNRFQSAPQAAYSDFDVLENPQFKERYLMFSLTYSLEEQSRGFLVMPQAKKEPSLSKCFDDREFSDHHSKNQIMLLENRP